MGPNKHRSRAQACWLIWLGLLLLAIPASAQTAPGFLGTAWKIPQYDERNRVRSVISGSKVTDSGDAKLLIENLRIDYYGEDGRIELVAEAPECTFHVKAQTVSSAGPLRAHSADRRFELSGRGFLAQQATSSLLLSNDVRARLQVDTNALTGGLAPTSLQTTNAGTPLEITSATFEISLTNKTAAFRDNVRARDEQFELTSGLLTARFAGTNRALDAIEAERDVVLVGRTDDSRVTADRAIYTITNDTAVLTGNPRFRQRDRAGRAERVMFNRRTRALEAHGGVELEAPREEISQSGFLLSTVGATNVATGGGGNLPPGRIKIFSHHLVSRSNLTVLDGDVRLVDGTNRLSTGRLTLESEGTNSTPVRAHAEGGLLVEQGAQRVKSESGVYERASESVTFLGRPEWRLEAMEGTADRLRVFPRTNAVQATGDLRVKLLRLGGVGALLPVFTNAPASTPGSNQPVELTAQEFVLTNRVASLTGGVAGRELPVTGAGTRFASERVVIQLAPGNGRAESAVASGGVRVEQGIAGVTNGPATYRRFEAVEVRTTMSPETGALRSLEADGPVRVQQAGGWATGGRAYYLAETDTVTLTNRPTASLGEISITEAAALLWHRGNGTVEVIGPHTVVVQPGSGIATNALPKLNFR